MTNSLPDLHGHLCVLKKQLLDSVLKTPYAALEPPRIFIKATLISLLLEESSVTDFALACALLSSSRSSIHELLIWIPNHLSTAAETAFSDLAKAYNDAVWVGEKRNLAAELMPEIVPVLKDKIKVSLIDSDETYKCFYAILAACQCRWLVSQIASPDLDEMVNLIIPWGLTCLDHWSPEVKRQGMISFIHVAKNVKGGALDSYGAAILYACRQNIASTDEIWQYLVEMSALLVSCIQRDNPRSLWFHKILTEMLSHLERQPRNIERRIAWLKFIEPIFNSMRLLLSPYFGRIFPLFFQWLHVNDDETVVLVLKRLHTIVRLTWIRKSLYFDRLVDELVVAYKEAVPRKAREEIENDILNLLIMLQQCLGLQFETAWNKHTSDLDVTILNRRLFVSRDYYLQSDRPKFFQPLRIDGPKEVSEPKAEERKSKPEKTKIDDPSPSWS
ncbi:hypothetical protein like AT2G39910 [Hibiscus trionum]|uniref:Uncharacterized protein n=1 Tax=Hibiscus trionum TaxID=183268 RepID=A0A9W7JK90_HIBTR|nr:hypothetical protein like AT2G39910 [Hibiscus trionum]